MHLAHDRKLTTLLFNPFVYIAGAQALGLGLAAILVTGLIGSFSHTHFDGVLDTHMGGRAPLGIFLSEGLADWLCLSLVLLIFGKIISNTAFRALDLFGTQALARWPTLFIGLVMLPPAIRRFSQDLLEQLTKQPGAFDLSAIHTTDAIIFFAAITATLPLLCWEIALMYNAYSVSCNVRGAKAIVTFIAGLILAEILSKIAVHELFKLT